MENINSWVAFVVLILLGITIINIIIALPSLYKKNFWICRDKNSALARTVYYACYHVTLLLVAAAVFVVLYMGEERWFPIVQQIHSWGREILFRN